MLEESYLIYSHTHISLVSSLARPSFVVIVGKSSLLMAIMGELTPSTGSVVVRGDVGYASQEAWIQSLSVRDNILFGRPYDEVVLYMERGGLQCGKCIVHL